MPNSAISSGYADLILPSEMIPEELIDFLKEGPLLKAIKMSRVSEKLSNGFKW
jgi:two-component system CheB/CheR fusion protein